jgi:hypothetical protein
MLMQIKSLEILLNQLNGLSIIPFLIALPNFEGHTKLTYLHQGLTLRSLIIKSNQIKSTLFRQGSHVSSEELVSM